MCLTSMAGGTGGVYFGGELYSWHVFYIWVVLFRAPLAVLHRLVGCYASPPARFYLDLQEVLPRALVGYFQHHCAQPEEAS